MSTRESTRRELQDLAKLAATMPKERPTPAPQATERVAAKPPRPNLQRPPTPSSISVTVPPAVASIPPPSAVAPAATSAGTKRRGGFVLSMALGLAVAIVGGAALGRTLAHRAAKPAAAAAVQNVAPPPASATPAADTPPAPTAAAAPSTPATATQPAVTPPGPTPQPVAAAAVPHAAPAVAPKAAAFVPKRTVKPATAAKSSLNANVPASGSGAKDPLEEAIRKAVASP